MNNDPCPAKTIQSGGQLQDYQRATEAAGGPTVAEYKDQPDYPLTYWIEVGAFWKDLVEVTERQWQAKAQECEQLKEQVDKLVNLQRQDRTEIESLTLRLVSIQSVIDRPRKDWQLSHERDTETVTLISNLMEESVVEGRETNEQIEGAESGFLPGRSRHSSTEGDSRQPETAEGARVATSRDRDAQPIPTADEGQEP